ncbi:DUF2079 domain-containing protein [Patescibacteria group bacterium]|nr:DUF2079 domain-containing protein [Patescibacteria group bacterium]MCL5091249.1 DUF2079 domain-containing protein [Patescibacteria group bacterium]
MGKTIKRRANRLPGLLMAAAIVVYISIFSYLSITRLLSFNAYYYDLGIMDQVVYNTAKGRVLRMTNPDQAKNISRLAIHFDPIMAVLSPLYLIKPSPEVLLISQTIILALGGLAIFLIGQRVLRSSWLALVFGWLYLNYYPLQLTNLFDFHAVIFGTTGLLFAFYFLALRPLRRDRLNLALGLIGVVVTLFSKENAALSLACLSLYLWLTKKDKKLAIILGGASVVMFSVVVFKVIPFFNRAAPFALAYYDFTHPFTLVQRLFSHDSLVYLKKIMSPFGFIPLVSPLTLSIALPDVLLNLLSSNSNMREIYYHYTALITPFVAVSAVYGFAKIRSALSHRLRPGAVTFILVAALIGCSVFTNFHYGLPGFPGYQIDKDALGAVLYWQNVLRDDRIRVAATGSIAPFFTERKHFYNFLFDPAYKNIGKTDADILKNIDKYDKADYVIVLVKDVTTHNHLVLEYYHHLKNNPKFSLIAATGKIEVYKKIACLYGYRVDQYR